MVIVTTSEKQFTFYTGVSSAADWMGKTYEDHPSLFVHRSVYNK